MLGFFFTFCCFLLFYFRSTPDQIRNLAQEVLEMKISLTPEQIKDLNTQVIDSFKNAKNIFIIDPRIANENQQYRRYFGWNQG